MQVKLVQSRAQGSMFHCYIKLRCIYHYPPQIKLLNICFRQVFSLIKAKNTLFYGHQMTFKYSWILHLLKVPNHWSPFSLSSFSQSFSAPFHSLGSGPIIATLLLCTLFSFSLKIPHFVFITDIASTHVHTYTLIFSPLAWLQHLSLRFVAYPFGFRCRRTELLPLKPLLSVSFPSSSRVFWPLFRYFLGFLLIHCLWIF